MKISRLRLQRFTKFEHFKLQKLHFNWALSYSYKFRVGKTGWQPPQKSIDSEFINMFSLGPSWAVTK